MLKRIYTLALLSLLLAFLAASFTACKAAEEPAPAPVQTERRLMLTEVEATTATVYYATLDKNYLLPLNININATKEAARVAMEKLLAGPPTSGAAPLLPQDTKLLDLYSSKSTVYVNVTRDIYDVERSHSRLAVDAILNTILPLAEGYTLQLLIEGQIVDRLGNVDISAPLALSYVNPDTESTALLHNLSQDKQVFSGVALTYYLSDSQGMFLVPQTMLLLPENISPAEQQDDDEAQAESMGHEEQDAQDMLPVAYSRAVLEAMLNPQVEDDALSSPFWPGTELFDLWLSDNILYVDFSAQLIGYGGGTATEIMMLDCLTQSLTTIPGVSAVQILIEGDIGSLPEGIDISRPLTPNTPVNPI